MFHDFINLMYPRLCHICEAELLANENILCTSCLHDLPLTNFHQDNENSLRKVFYGRVKIESAVALLHFRKKASAQKLIHDLKYRGHQEIGTYFGKWLGAELADVENFKNISAVIPVPLHPSKLKIRGYNQVTKFGEEISKALNANFFEDILIEVSAAESQTLKNRIARWGKIEESLQIQNSEKIENNHILLVDDLVTTGSTIEACVHKLQEIPGIKISVATLAFTK